MNPSPRLLDLPTRRRRFRGPLRSGAGRQIPATGVEGRVVNTAPAGYASWHHTVISTTAETFTNRAARTG